MLAPAAAATASTLPLASTSTAMTWLQPAAVVATVFHVHDVAPCSWKMTESSS